MKHLYTAILILLGFSSYAQSGKGLFNGNINAHVDVLPLLFPDPAVRFGSEWMPGGRWSFGLNLGVGALIRKNTGMGFPQPRWENGYRLIEIRPEVKYYWRKRDLAGWYVASEVFVSKMNATSGKSYHFLEGSNSTQLNFDRADFQKTKLGVIGKVGVKCLIGERMTLDLFSGLGISHTRASYDNYQNPVTGKSDPFFEGENYSVGKWLMPHLSFGVRFGLILWDGHSKL